jgi:hypothetical protein
MPDIHFYCPSCNQSLDAPGELANQLIECPTCKETIDIPARSRPRQPPPQIADPFSHQATLQPTTRPAPSVPYAVKVLTTKDRFFSSKFAPETLEAAFNSGVFWAAF